MGRSISSRGVDLFENLFLEEEAESFEDLMEELNAERIIEIHDRIIEKAKATSLPIS
ncbi:MAG: hypothetical protein V1854_02855 [Methanobacteriota archaeon]